MDEPTNRELKIMLDNHVQRSEERHTETLDVLRQIKNDVGTTKEQTLKTNGRVSRLEWWRNGVVGVIAVLVGFIGYIFPYMLKVINTQIKDTANQITQTLVQSADFREMVYKQAKDAVVDQLSSYDEIYQIYESE